MPWMTFFLYFFFLHCWLFISLCLNCWTMAQQIGTMLFVEEKDVIYDVNGAVRMPMLSMDNAQHIVCTMSAVARARGC